jgi:hypothetical protein
VFFISFFCYTFTAKLYNNCLNPMKNLLLKGNAPVILFLFVLAFMANSCKKDVTLSQTTPLTQKQQLDVVNEAKTWFQKNEAINKPSVAINDAGGTRKWYDGLNPGWDNTLVYEKDKGIFIEMPLLNSSVAFLMNTTDGSKATQQNNYTKTTYLIQKDSVGVFKGWFMVLIADTTYINGDFSKLDKNTYQQRDPAYSGRLMYFNINGKFVGGWRYQNGVITKTLTLTSAATAGGGPQINSENPKGTMGVGSCTVTPVVTVSWICAGFDGTNHTASIRTNDVACEPSYSVTGYALECSGGGSGGGGGSTNPGDGTGGNNGNTNFPAPPKPPCLNVASVDGKQVNLQPPVPTNPVPTNPDDPCAVKPPDLVPPIIEDPCDKLKKAKAKFADITNTQKYADVLAKPGTDEYGSDIKLTAPNSTSPYKPTSITSTGQDDWSSTFTWNSADGYTIGSVHRHQVAAPSPDDVFGLVAGLLSSDMLLASASSKQFYRDNAYATIVSSTATYTITVSNWGVLSQMYDDYKNNPKAYSNEFLRQASEYQVVNNVSEATATTQILMNFFDGAINLYKAPVGTTTYAVAGIDQNGQFIIVPCPQ